VLNNQSLAKLLEAKQGKVEPTLPKFLSDSFLFVPTAGLRETPDILLLELFRELFFTQFSSSKGQHHLDPGISDPSIYLDYSEKEKAILYLTRGRVKRIKGRESSGFYSPAYASMARGGWLRPEAEHQIRDSLFKGFIAQSLKLLPTDIRAERVRSISAMVINALIGHNSNSTPSGQGVEFLWEAVKGSNISENDGLRSSTQAIENLSEVMQEAIDGVKRRSYTFVSPKSDEYSEALSNDFLELCKLEARIPRLQWLEILKCYLRIANSSWILSKMKITVWLRDQILRAIEHPDYFIQESDFFKFLSDRNRNLFIASSGATDGPNIHVKTYVRARIELTLLTYALQSLDVVEDFSAKELVGSNGNRTDRMPAEEFIILFKQHRAKLNQLFGGLSTRQWLIRNCEIYPGWTDPFKKGQGKPLSEALRVLSRSEINDGDSGYLVTPIRGVGRSHSYSIFPGPMLIKTVVYLAAKVKAQNNPSGRLVLSDVENHFKFYGIEFGVAAGARPRLISELQDLGLLNGSPDAGDSVEVKSPFN
jgi:hypothetical protein